MKRIFTVILILLGAAQILSAQYDRDVFYFRGRNFLADGKYAQAIENFNILARLDTTDYWTFFYRGIAKYSLGDVRGAEQDFDTSVRLNPVFTNGYHYRAITSSRLGDYDSAFNDFDRAIELRPGFIGIYFSRGVTYFLAQRFEEAVKDFDYYIRKEPKDPSAYLNRGASYLFLGDTLKAINDYNKAIKIDRYEPEGYIRRGRLYAELKRYDEAIGDMSHALEIDPSNTMAYFTRALMYYEQHDYNSAMADLNRVLKEEPGNALTLYNRSLISAQVGDFESALADMDRVISINPRNVLAYFNRASYFIEMGKWQDAVEDYDKAIELYPDFAKAYMNRAYVESMLGRMKDSREDYQTAQEKVREYRAKNSTDAGSFADTTRKYSALIAFDADFAKKDFDDEMLQHRDIDIRLKPLYRFALTSAPQERISSAISHRFENVLLDRFTGDSPLPVIVTNDTSVPTYIASGNLENVIYGDTSAGAGQTVITHSMLEFLKGMYDVQNRQFSAALAEYDEAVRRASEDTSVEKYSDFYKAFYQMNRGVLRADMIDFIASIQNNVQTLTMDDQGTTRARLSDQVSHTYDYSEAIEDMEAAAEALPDVPYFHFNLGNLHCLSSQLVESIESYTRAIAIYPYMGDAFYNRGLVLIYLKDKEKGCIDLSRAGELGVAEAYGVIAKYCEEEN